MTKKLTILGIVAVIIGLSDLRVQHKKPTVEVQNGAYISMIKKIICIGMVLVICLGLFAGCTQKPSNIIASAMFSKNVLALPILGIQPNAPGHYKIDLSIDELFSKIKVDESLSVKLIDSKIFISKDNNDGTKDYFVIRDSSSGDIKFYEFFNMEGQIYFPYNMSKQSILIPYHLIVDPNSLYSSLKINEEYKTKFNTKDFFDFYNKSGWYNVDMGEDYIVIKGYIDHEKTSALNFIPIQIHFKSSDEPDVNIFVLSIME